MKRKQARNKSTGRYTDHIPFTTRLIIFLIFMVMCVASLGAIFAQKAVSGWIDTQIHMQDQVLQLTRENEGLRLELQQEQDTARTEEALWWTESSSAVITHYLRGDDTEAHAEIRKQGDRLTKMRTK